ncbi:hypothetical protein [Devosia sp. RR2S18]|jgi:hypothetical protein|uniref:hypothetical protein n=1 Tax=Devosia rhizosphaerae TaxID=3049774 RepID=UPI00254179D5|nr:hypothetical protein [Devosia sp. RR2S18]WIJ25165.1 hypothetical protein QOV41_19505 [Devosia sp. RR2S18]HEV7292468.1 hypothetical protein [Devosia sp.]
MSLERQIEFTVESYNTDPEGRPQQSDVCKVMATSAEAAALMVLQEDLHTIGETRRLRARVRHKTIAGVEKVTILYSRHGSA